MLRRLEAFGISTSKVVAEQALVTCALIVLAAAPSLAVEARRLVRLRTAIDLRGQRAPRHHHDPDDSFVVERQAHCEVTLIRHFASFTPAGDLVRPGNYVALNVLELGLRLFRGELLVSARLLKHLPARCDTTKGAARRHGLDIGIEERFRRV
jgi:hypothetical protein